MSTERKRLYLDPAVFREGFTIAEYERATNRLMPQLSTALKIDNQRASDALKTCLIRNIFPSVVEEIMNLAREKQNGEAYQ